MTASLTRRLEKMTKKELIHLITSYDKYLFVEYDDEFKTLGRAPKCVEEFLNNEYHEYL